MYSTLLHYVFYITTLCILHYYIMYSTLLYTMFKGYIWLKIMLLRFDYGQTFQNARLTVICHLKLAHGKVTKNIRHTKPI